MKGKSILIFFILVALVDLFFVASPACNQFRIFSKPLLMPVLAVFLVGSGLTSARKKMLLAGLAFATAGDILLLKMESTPYFMGGLISFLLTHICYVFYFASFKSSEKKLYQQYPFLFILILMYAGTLIYFLYPHLGTMLVPVIVYTVVLMSMLIACLYAYYGFRKETRNLFLGGSVLFVLSDSVLAVNTFHTAFSGAGIIIMSTYCAAQALIVYAASRNN